MRGVVPAGSATYWSERLGGDPPIRPDLVVVGPIAGHECACPTIEREGELVAMLHTSDCAQSCAGFAQILDDGVAFGLSGTVTGDEFAGALRGIQPAAVPAALDLEAEAEAAEFVRGAMRDWIAEAAAADPRESAVVAAVTAAERDRADRRSALHVRLHAYLWRDPYTVEDELDALMLLTAAEQDELVSAIEAGHITATGLRVRDFVGNRWDVERAWQRLRDTDTPSRPRVWSATELDEARSLEWVADGRIVAGAINYMVGPEGIGKSLFAVWLTALLTTGRGCPGFGIAAGEPRDVALVLTEDDWSTIARPRLEVAEADLNRVRLICADSDGSGAPTFPEDMDIALEAADGAVAIIVDAWADTLPARLSVRDPQQARQALHPWKELATRTGCAVLLAGHLNREKGGNVRAAYGMTGELRKKVRSSLLALGDPDVEGQLILGPEKSNVGAPRAGSRFRITSTPASGIGAGTVPLLEYVGDADMTMADLFGVVAAHSADGTDSIERTECDEWLAELLGDGPMDRVEVLKAGRSNGFSDSTIKRSRSRLGVESVASGAAKNAKRWALPSTPKPAELYPFIGPPAA